MLGTVVLIVIIVAAGVFGTFAFRARARGRIRMGVGLRHGAGREFLVGVSITAVAMAAVFGVESALELVRVEGHAVRVGPLAVAVGVLLVLVAAEEVAYRLLLLNGLWVVTGRAVVAVGVSAVLFGLGHAANDGATVLSVTSNALGGVMYGLAFVLTRRVWLPLGMHVAWNVVQGPVLGFAVSGTTESSGFVLRQSLPQGGPDWLTGGVYGPEGGVIGIGARVLVLVLVVLAARTVLRRPAHDEVSTTER